MDSVVTLWSSLTGILSTEFFAALAAALSLVVAWRQHIWNKKNHLASVRPFITAFLNQGNTPLRFTYSLINKGLGPALINEFKAYWDGQPITMNDLRRKLYEDMGTHFEIHIGEFNEHFALSIGEEFMVLDIVLIQRRIPLSANPQQELDEITAKLIKSCRIEVKYRSFLSDEVQTFKTKVLEALATEHGLVINE